MIKDRLAFVVRKADTAIGRAYVHSFGEHGVLLILLFHSLFRDKAEIEKGLLYPQQQITLSVFEECLAYFMQHGYQFVSPRDLERGLAQEGRHLMLTFDDGYYNNTLALPILEKYTVPAVFFVSTNYTQEQRPFWWDVLYRERKKEGKSGREIVGEVKKIKTLSLLQRESYLREMFGGASGRVIADIDRPFTPEELRRFAHHELVYIGNHTLDHALLARCTPEEMREQIRGAQVAIKDMVGYLPTIISYPNGTISPAVINEASDAGLHFGITTEDRSNTLPLSEPLQLGRMTLWGDRPLHKQFVSLRHGRRFSIERGLRSLRQRL